MDWTAKFLKDYLSDKNVDKDTRIALGRIIEEEIKSYAQNDRGLRQKMYEVIDGVAQYIHTRKED